MEYLLVFKVGPSTVYPPPWGPAPNWTLCLLARWDPEPESRHRGSGSGVTLRHSHGSHHYTNGLCFIKEKENVCDLLKYLKIHVSCVLHVMSNSISLFNQADIWLMKKAGFLEVLPLTFHFSLAQTDIGRGWRQGTEAGAGADSSPVIIRYKLQTGPLLFPFDICYKR